uniref:Uncharacterized protein n=1 Tax=Arundo donax TaxID=35708 RepID=A0A0A8ZQA6_ARUDO
MQYVASFPTSKTDHLYALQKRLISKYVDGRERERE